MADNQLISSIQTEIDKLAKELEHIEASRSQKKADLKQHRKALAALTSHTRRKKETS